MNPHDGRRAGTVTSSADAELASPSSESAAGPVVLYIHGSVRHRPVVRERLGRLDSHVVVASDVADAIRQLDARRAAFFARAQFFRDIDRPSTPETLEQMVENWYRLGVVTEQPGPGDPAFPPVFTVSGRMPAERIA